MANCDPKPTIEKHVCFILPKWAIETWFKFLRSEAYDENVRIDPSDKYVCATDCFAQADTLVKICRGQASMGSNPPLSLEMACDRFGQIKSELRKQ